MELNYIVYITINLCNGKFYIGVHKTNPNTFDGYIGCGIYTQSLANKDYPFHRAVRKYGYSNFKRTTIQTFPNTEEGRIQASNLEKILVNETLLRSKSTYNTALGGLGGNNPNDYKRVYMFDLKGSFLRSYNCSRTAALDLAPDRVESTRVGIKNVCLGYTNSCLGYYWNYQKKFNYTNLVKTKVAQYTIGGKFLRYYDSIEEAQSELGINTIQLAITKSYSSAGYQWKYYTGDSSDITPLVSIFNRNHILPINMYDTNNNLIGTYSNISECIKLNLLLSSSLINRVLKGIIRSHKGFVFKYKDEDIVLTNLK